VYIIEQRNVKKEEAGFEAVKVDRK